MMNKIEKKLEEFISGELSEDDAKQIREELQKNPKLTKEKELRELIDNVIKEDKEVIDFRINLAKLSRESKKQKMSLPMKRKWYIAAASITVALASGASAFLILNNQSRPEDIFKVYYQTPKPIKIVRSGTNFPGDTFNRDMQIYSDGNYDEASRRLIKYSSNPAARFYAAISYMEIGQYNNAESILSFIASNPSDLFYDQAQWYLGLCYLMNNKKQEAIDVFSRIAHSQNLYNDKAAQILSKLQ